MRNLEMFMKIIACLLVLPIMVMPVSSYAYPVRELTAEQKKEIVNNAQYSTTADASLLNMDSISVNSGVLSLPGQDGTTITINLTELYSDAGALPASYSVSELQDSYTDINVLEGNGRAAKQVMFADANQDDPSTVTGAAYKILLDATNEPDIDITADPIFENSYKVFEELNEAYDAVGGGAAGMFESFTDCTNESTFTPIDFESHVPEYEACDDVYKPEGGCRILHEVTVDNEPADIVFLIDNSRSMRGIIDDLINNIAGFANIASGGTLGELRIGGAVIRKNKWQGNNTPLTNPAAFKTWVQGINIDRGSTRPIRATQWAAGHFDWRDDVKRIIVVIGNDESDGDPYLARNALSRHDVDAFIYHDHHEVKSIGTVLDETFNGTSLLAFAQTFVILNDVWTPESCIREAEQATFEEFCSGDYEAFPQSLTTTGCSEFAGFRICEGDYLYNQLAPAPLPEVLNNATHIDLEELDCSFNHGEGTCWTDTTGAQQCLSSYEDVDGCEPLIDDPSCSFVSTSCIEGATGVNGTCYAQEQIWDCGYPVTVESLSSETSIACGGPISCMGTDCLNVDPTDGSDFARANALLNAAQFMTQDMNCDGSSGCTVFAGEDMECKTAVGGAQDCCEKPSGVSVADYLTLIMQVPKIHAGIMAIENGNTVVSAYQSMAQGVSNTANPFTSYIDSISNTVDTFVDNISDKIVEMIDALKQKIAEITGETLGSASASTGTTATAAGTTAAEDGAADAASDGMLEQVFGESVGGMIGSVMYAYTIYVIAMLVIQLVWACEEEEFDLNYKRALGNCSLLGSYCKGVLCLEKRRVFCCFNSPLSRMINEQMRVQLGITTPDLENPTCEGVPIDRLSDIDWSTIDLTEWTAILAEHGNLDFDTMDMETLTGLGNVFDTDGTRKTADVRNAERAAMVDFKDMLKKAKENVAVERGDDDGEP